MPYDAESLTGLTEFLELVTGPERVNQIDLEAALRLVPTVKEIRKPACQFLGSGAYAASGVDQFRDIEAYTGSAVLETDVSLVINCKRNRAPFDGCLLPVPLRFRNTAPPNPPELPQHLFIAPDRHYVPSIGFCDQPLAVGDPPPCLPSSPYIL